MRPKTPIDNITDRPIKVCFIMPKAYPLFNPAVKGVFGGAEVDVYMLACELAKDHRFAVSCITADYGQSPIENIRDVTIRKSLNFQKTVFSQTIRLWRALTAADADIYFQKTASLGTFLVWAFCSRRRKIFMYRTSHTDECDGTYLKSHRIAGRLFGWAIRRAKGVFVQNRSDVDDLRRTYGVTSIPIPNAHAVPERVGESAGRKDILWVGRSVQMKQPTKFLQLAREFPAEQFTMICPQGTGDKNYDSLRQEAQAVRNLTFIEGVGFSRIDDFFNQAKLFVSTSDAEGFPNTFIQAGKWGVPILSLKVNPDDFLNQYQCGLCAGGNWEVFTDQFRQLLTPEIAKNYGDNGRKYIENNHKIETIIERYKEIMLCVFKSTNTCIGDTDHKNSCHAF